MTAFSKSPFLPDQIITKENYLTPTFTLRFDKIRKKTIRNERQIIIVAVILIVKKNKKPLKDVCFQGFLKAEGTGLEPATPFEAPHFQ